ncbi:hypothetical protein [Solilutibacter silvestris]|uniref:Uncharacterized protein n=1 Tax=Solilutibacter silvestris TaxID=1645665 RepID=A0A2K1Q005_9GAMM|nr:hypothetical protein [Lysobacter silvestris]PNS08374.1 hypothetical protein Lysil_0003 [Lysobacter silvestris]
MKKLSDRFTTTGLTRLYLSFVGLVVAAIIVILLLYFGAYDSGVLVVALMVVCLVPLIAHPVFSVTNSVIRLFVRSLPLSAIDADNVAAENTTLVVIPDLILDSQKIDALADRIRDHFLANDDPNVFFGVLTDWGDAPTEHLPTDDEQLSQIQHRISELNETYGSANRRPFFLLHRGRRWNAYDSVWMGYERKRGKLEDLNDFILRGNASHFPVVEGDICALRRAKYVITLDNDTRLPPGAALQLISILAHPANEPRMDGTSVVSGHGILQPRMMASIPTGAASWFERFWVRQRGTDPKKLHFDIFQDFFGEGCFTGVGIYEVAAFDMSLRGMIPENHLLSHDVVEGCFARAGWAGNVILYETVPPTYHAASRRHHRWMRGDWQNGTWLFPSVPSATGRRKNTFSLLSRWKILKCILASLFPASIALLQFLCVMTDRTYRSAIVSLASVLIPIVVVVIVKKVQGAQTSFRTYKDCAVYAFITVAFAPFEGARNVDAACRAIYRIAGSKRRGLEWVPSSEYDADDLGVMGYVRYMWISPAAALLLAVWVHIWSASWNPLIVAVICAWAVAPFVAWQMSQRYEEVTIEQVASDSNHEAIN